MRFYRGLHRVRVVTESQGYWIVEALEDFQDCVDNKQIAVKAGEQRIVPPSLLYKEKTLPPMVEEHKYELEMERKVKRLLAKEEKKAEKQ